MAHQISVFVENKPGRVERVTEVLAKAKVNIRAFTVSSSYEYGVMKFLVDKPDKALEAIQSQGISANKREILAVLMDDRPGDCTASPRSLAKGRSTSKTPTASSSKTRNGPS